MINTLRNIFLRDFWLKLFSLVLAVLIWLIVWLFAIKQDVAPSAGLRGISSLETRVFMNIPVQAVSAASDVRNFKINPGQVNVTVRGETKSFQNLQPTNIHAIVNLTRFNSASDLTNKIEVSVPPNIMLLSTEPDTVEVIIPAKR